MTIRSIDPLIDRYRRSPYDFTAEITAVDVAVDRCRKRGRKNM